MTHTNYLEPYQDAEADVSAPTTFMCGAAPVFTPDAWRALGGFREDLFLYWEDAELSLRAQDLGLRMTIAADAVVWHAVGGTGEGSGQSKNFYYYSARNRLKIMFGRGQGRRLLTPYGLMSLAKFALRPLRREKQDRLAKCALVVRGYVEGYRASRRDGPPSGDAPSA